MPNNESQTSRGVPRYSIITQNSTPVMLRNMFDLIESRYVRRARYTTDVNALIREIDRLNLLNDYTPYIDNEGNLCFRVPDTATEGLLSINAAGELILNDDESETAAAFAQMRFHINEDGYLIVTQVDPDDGV